MKKIIIVCALALCALSVSAQVDTIFSAGKKIPCTIKEVGQDAIKFVYPDEELVNTLSPNIIEKIVFRNGRVQTFANSSTLKVMNSPEDYDKIVFAQLESEITGLYKMGETNAKAKGTTEFSSQERVKQRAIRKLKQKAAMIGGNLIFMLNMRSEGNKVNGGAFFSTLGGWGGGWSGSSAETSLTGIVYTNNLPNVELFRSNFGQAKQLKIRQSFKLANSDSDYTISPENKDFTLTNVNYDNGFINIEGKIGNKAASLRVSYVNKDNFYAYLTDKNSITCYKFEK